MNLITVLGASGFIGSAVTRALAQQPIRLRALARRQFTPAPGDSTPFRAITGWRPEISLSEGVRRTVAALPTSVHGKART